MTDGTSMLAAPTYPSVAAGLSHDQRGDDVLDGGAPFYDTYKAAERRYVAVAFSSRVLRRVRRLLPLDAGLAARQYDRAAWDEHARGDRRTLSEKSRDRWAEAFRRLGRMRRAGAVAGQGTRASHNRARQMHLDGADSSARRRRRALQPPREWQSRRKARHLTGRVLGRFGIGEPKRCG